MKKETIKALLNKEPEAIVKWFESKGYTFTWNWYETWQESHTKAFSVAKVMRLDILTDIRTEVENAIKEGITFEQFKKNLIPTLQEKGWWGKVALGDGKGEVKEVQLGSVRRLRTIYETNLTTSYKTGQFQNQWENKDDRPYWMYVSKLLPTTRESHRALHGKVFLATDPFWNTHYPPNDWGCQCDVIALTKEELDGFKVYNLEPEKDEFGKQIVKDGIPQYKRVETSPEISSSSGKLITKKVTLKNGEEVEVTGYRDQKTGKVTFTGPGWNYNVGKEAYYPDLSKYDKDLLEQYQKLKDQAEDTMINQLINAIGKDKKVFIKINNNLEKIKKGMEVDIYNNQKTKIFKVYKDILNNESYITEFHYKEHIKPNVDKAIIEKILKNPNYILKDKKENAIIYIKIINGKYYSVPVGKDSNRIFTIITNRDALFSNRERYEIIYGK